PYADREVELSSRKIDEFVGDRKAQRQVRKGELESPDGSRKPGRAERNRRAHGKHAGAFFAKVGKDLTHSGEGIAYRNQQSPAHVGQLDASALAREELVADPILQLANLVADRGLRHPQLLRRAREVLVPSGGF